MSSASRMIQRPSRMISDAYDRVVHGKHSSMHLTKSTGGGLLGLGVIVFLFIWLYPELKRYIRISRM